MPEVLGIPPSPRTVLFWNGTAWQWGLVDAAGHLQIDIVTSALPAGAATAANQVIINTTVGLVALIRNALQTVAADRLIARGEDQLHSISDMLADKTDTAISGANGYIDCTPVPAGKIFVVTNTCSEDVTSPTTAHRHYIRRPPSDYQFHQETKAFAAGDRSLWHNWIWLFPGDLVRAEFAGGLALDRCILTLTGHWMTLEV